MGLVGKLLKLRKAVYGLIDAPLQWYRALHEALLNMGARVVPFDPAIYLFGDTSDLIGWAAVHVDDISMAGYDSFLEDILKRLKAQLWVVKRERSMSIVEFSYAVNEIPKET